MAGVRLGRSAAYQLLRNVRLWGEAALQDGRHGHPAKLREPVRQWLEMTCREAPQTPSHVVQAALQERFGILISLLSQGEASHVVYRTSVCPSLAHPRAT
jgi:transposase